MRDVHWSMHGGVLATVGMLMLVACGGVAEQRIGTIEANLRLLDQNAAQKLDKHERRMADLEKAVATVWEKGQTQAGADNGGNNPALEQQIAALNVRLQLIQQKQESQAQQLDAKLRGVKDANPSTTVVNKVIKRPVPDFPEDELYALLGLEEDGVEEVDDHTFEVTGSWLRKAVKATAITSKKPRFKPFRNGGIRVMRVSRRSPLGKLGLKNQDVILRFNGQDVNNTSELFDVIRDSSGTNFTLKVKRRDQEIELNYH